MSERERVREREKERNKKRKYKSDKKVEGHKYFQMKQNVVQREQ